MRKNRRALIGALACLVASATLGVPHASVAEGLVSFSDCPNGSTRVLPSRINARLDGGTDVVYESGSAVTIVRIPPRDFNPLTATDDALAEFGFPARPTNATDVAAWSEDLGVWHVNTDATLCEESRVSAMTSLSPDPDGVPIADVGSPAWSGYVATGATRNAYIGIKGDFLQPAAIENSCTGSALTSWVGLGGSTLSPLTSTAPRLIQAGTVVQSVTATPRAFYEVVAANDVAGSTMQILAGVRINPGDRIQVQISVQRTADIAYFYVHNATNGDTQTATVAGVMANSYDGFTAEWMDERPWSTSLSRNLPLLGFNQVAWSNARALNTDGTWSDLGQLPLSRKVMSPQMRFWQDRTC